ncbi:MAG: FABP family protein [Deltaproteobacteria bacterium]|nr:MAG: FABP family protein [Deltaproteobacteria bacterium]
MSHDNYGPLAFFIGNWKSEGWTGDNVAPDPDRNTENTSFRQETSFDPIGDVENHEQLLYALRYRTTAWEEGDDEDPFHEEVGYFIWDAERKQVMKSFIVPRGIAVNAGGDAQEDSKEFFLQADCGSETYGVCSNKFLDEEFKTVRYEVKFTKIDDNTFSYDEDTIIKMKGRDELFHHTEKNVMKRL